MEGIEIEGKTIDEAIEKACSKFQVPREKLNIEIIAEGNSGFLGIGAKKALIRASLLSIDMTIDTLFARMEPSPPARESQSPPPAEKQPPSAAPERVPPPSRAERPSPAKRAFEGNGAAAADDAPRHHQPAPKPHPHPIHPPQPAAKPKAQESQAEQAPAARPRPTPAAEEGEPSAQRAQRILEGLLVRMQIPSPVTVAETEEAIVLNIQGDGSGLLIGKRGQNLDAIQYILNKAVHHTANGHKMIIIDTEEYRKRREESLIALAVRLGEKVRKTKKPVTVGHMNAHDRRVIHMAMQGDEALTTKSRGEGEYRKIVILPARRGADQTEA